MLSAQAIGILDLSEDILVDIFQLYDKYYCLGDLARFKSDIANKSRIILLENEGKIVGFSTFSHYLFSYLGQEVAVLFSGDTILDRPYWGQQTLASAWLREAAAVAKLYPEHELYWFLIVKGHRTYRYLPTFAEQFVPDWRSDKQDPFLTGLRDALAKDRFGSAYDMSTGVISFGGALDQLRPPWSEPSARERLRPDVDFFLQSNPEYRRGDELACLCRISAENMNPMARRIFAKSLGV